jgi:hypothetical protein
MSSIQLSRALARTGLVCLAAIVVVLFQSAILSNRAVASTLAPRTPVTEKTSLDVDARALHSSASVDLAVEGGSLMAYPPAKVAGERPLAVVYLHGAHGRADKGCPWMRSGATNVGWLVCPKAPNAEPQGVASWGADVRAQSVVVKRAFAAAQASGASGDPGVIVGFSQGSYVAIDIIKLGLLEARGLVLLGAEMHPDANRLRAAGVKRVAFGAGREDAAFASLQEETRRLAAEGIETLFVDLGAVGHTYAADDTTALNDAIVWASGSRGHDRSRT